MNLDFIKNKLDVLQGKNKQSAKFWKPPEGESRVRILPYKHNKENPFIELKFYYFRQPTGVMKTLLSPSVNGNPDPILKFCEKLRSTGTKENWILSRTYEPKLRTFVPILVRGQEHEGVKFWGFGKQAYEAILEKMANPDIGDITDLQNGNDLIIKFTKTPSSGKKYPETKIDVRIKKTPAIDPTDQELFTKIQDQVDIMTLFTEPTYEDLEQEFKNHLNPEPDSENDPVSDLDPDSIPDQYGSSETDSTKIPNEDSVADTSADGKPPTPAPMPEVTDAKESSTANLSPDAMKEKFKQMFANAVR